MPYAKHFTKPYAEGYKDRPDTSTPVTANIKNMEDSTFEAVEEYLTNGITNEYLPKGARLADLTQDAEHRTVTDAEKEKWNAGAVSSVNGQTGAVTLTASDVGADAAGAATQALTSANTYTDEKFGKLPTEFAPADAEKNVIEGITMNGAAVNPDAEGIVHLTGGGGGSGGGAVSSVNGKTGDVNLTAEDMGLADAVLLAKEGEVTELPVATDLPFGFAIDAEGNYGYIKNDGTFVPFNSGGGGMAFNALDISIYIKEFVEIIETSES